MKPEIYMKMLRNLSEKLRAKFPMSTRGYSRVKITCLNDAFSDVSNWKQALQKVNHWRKKVRKGEKGEAKK